MSDLSLKIENEADDLYDFAYENELCYSVRIGRIIRPDSAANTGHLLEASSHAHVHKFSAPIFLKSTRSAPTKRNRVVVPLPPREKDTRPASPFLEDDPDFEWIAYFRERAMAIALVKGHTKVLDSLDCGEVTKKILRRKGEFQ